MTVREIQQTKKCAYCAEEILVDASICKHCGNNPSKTLRDFTAILSLAVIALIVYVAFTIWTHYF